MSLTKYQHLPNTPVICTGDKTLNLTELSNNNILLYFYPKDSTPGCTTEGQNFKASHHDFLQSDCLIFGISRDSISSHDNFKAKQQFPFDLISDPHEILCQYFDVIKLKKLYGKEYLGIERSTFLFHQGSCIQEWRKVKVRDHVAEVLNYLQKLSKP